MGVVLVGTFLFAPPELDETGTIRKHWNNATIYAETKRVLEQLSEIRALECSLKNWNLESVQIVEIQTHTGSTH